MYEYIIKFSNGVHRAGVFHHLCDLFGIISELEWKIHNECGAKIENIDVWRRRNESKLP